MYHSFTKVDQIHHVPYIYSLWPPCVADAVIIFLPCGFFLSSILYLFYSSPNLSGRRLDVYHTSTHGVDQCEFRMQF